MPCQNKNTKELERLEIQTYIRDYHGYKDSYTSLLGETFQ